MEDAMRKLLSVVIQVAGLIVLASITYAALISIGVYVGAI